MIKIRDCGPQINARHIADVEAAIGRELPASYKAFLLKENGGLPTPDTVDIEAAPGSPTDVQVFFGIGRDVKSSDLSWNMDLVRKRWPNLRLLPVACDSGGGLFCLDLFEEFTGGVMYCELSGPHIVCYEVASNFESFLEKIREWKQ
jgi:SMI1-KNR4 cell-wall